MPPMNNSQNIEINTLSEYFVNIDSEYFIAEYSNISKPADAILSDSIASDKFIS